MIRDKDREAIPNGYVQPNPCRNNQSRGTRFSFHFASKEATMGVPEDQDHGDAFGGCETLVLSKILLLFIV